MATKFRNNVTTTVDDHTADWIDAQARKANKTRSAWIRQQLEALRDGEARTEMKVSRGLPASMASPSADDDHPYDHDTQLPEDIFFCWCGTSKDLHGTPQNEI